MLFRSSEWFYSKQTINSAIKTLTARGLATLEFADDIAEAKTEAMDVKLNDIEIKR